MINFSKTRKLIQSSFNSFLLYQQLSTDIITLRQIRTHSDALRQFLTQLGS